MIKQVFALCDYTHTSLIPWREAGFECHAIDIRPALRSDDGITHHQASVLEFDFSSFDPCFCVAFPPCTHLAIGGAVWWKAKGQTALAEALELVFACRDAFDCPTIIENPVGRLPWHWKAPDTKVHPWEFSGYPGASKDNYTKATCLWLLRGAKPPLKRYFIGTDWEVDKTRILHASSGARDKTPIGLARGIYEANK